MILKKQLYLQVSDDTTLVVPSTQSDTVVTSTGLSNSQLDSHLTAKIDWIQFTFKFNTRARFSATIEGTFLRLGDTPTFDEGKGYSVAPSVYYHNQGYGVSGTKFWWSEPGEQSGSVYGKALVAIPAKALCTRTQEQVLELLSWLLIHCEVTFKRTDVAIDDYSKSIGHERILSALIAKNYAGFEENTFIKKGNKKGGNLGFTIYLGSRNSDYFCRYYDKEVESKGLIKSYRLEAVFKNEKAHQLVQAYVSLAGSNGLHARFLGQSAIGRIDFVEPITKAGHKNRKRRKKLDWWEKFVERVGGQIRFSLPAIDPTLQATANWVKRQVAGTLAVLRRTLGTLDYRAWLDTLVEQKDANMSARNEAKCEAWMFLKHQVFGAIPHKESPFNKKGAAQVTTVEDNTYEYPEAPFLVGSIVRHKVDDIARKVIACTHTHAQLQGLEKAVSVYLLQPV